MKEKEARELTAKVESVLPENSGYVLLTYGADNDVGICSNVHPDDVLISLKQIVEQMEKRKKNGFTAMNVHDK